MLILELLADDHPDPGDPRRHVIMYDKFPTRKYKYRVTFPERDAHLDTHKQWSEMYNTVTKLPLYNRWRMDVIIQHRQHYVIRWNYIEFMTKRDMTLFMLAYTGPKGRYD